jgi:hypothetical protein
MSHAERSTQMRANSVGSNAPSLCGFSLPGTRARNMHHANASPLALAPHIHPVAA